MTMRQLSMSLAEHWVQRKYEVNSFAKIGSRRVPFKNTWNEYGIQ